MRLDCMRTTAATRGVEINNAMYLFMGKSRTAITTSLLVDNGENALLGKAFKPLLVTAMLTIFTCSFKYDRLIIMATLETV